MPELVVIGIMLTAGAVGRIGEWLWHLSRTRYGP